MDNKRKPIPENISHYAQLRNGEFMGHWDLEKNKDYKVVIESLNTEEVFNTANNKKEVKTTASFKGATKRLILNATNMKNISTLYGDTPKNWIGKEVSLYRTETRIAKEKVDCIRIRGKSKSETATDSAE